MSGALIKVLMTNERRTNRSCAVAALWVSAVVGLICLIGLTEALYISPWWMIYYLGAVILPVLAVVAYAKIRDYQGGEVKFLMILAAALVPAGIAVPTILGFFLMPLPIVVAGRYFSRRFVWETYVATMALAGIMTLPHARYGIPCYPLCEEARGSLQLFLNGQFDHWRYWRYLVVHCFPSFALCLSFFTITMSRLCKDHLEAMLLEAKTNARLADVEKGLVLAAAAQLTAEFRSPEDAASGDGRSQPDVTNWSAKAITDCLARVRCRAAEDAAFAALVERDPAAAVKEVQS